MSDDQVQRLAQLGLNSYEAKAYLALLGKDTFSATQVADLSGVPRQRIYDILTGLVDRGLAVSRPGKRGLRYSAVAPSTALNTLLEQEQARLSALEETTRDLVTSLASRYRAGQEESSPLDYIEVLRGPAVISQRFAEIQASCQREILIFTKPPYARPLEENVEGIEALDRRIQGRSLYEYQVLEDEEMRQVVASFIEHGAEARFVDHLPLKLVIVDEEIVMFAMEDPIAGRTELTIMVIHNRQLAQVMKSAFDSYWERGEPLEQACRRLGFPNGSKQSP
jgi:HTH-type transcriptional regulator, sugar sensing transcriptional regulator